ncbi:MAG: GNAT family N-acetyltransferase [Fimbriimonas sp.]
MTLRPATRADAPAIADVILAARRTMTYVPLDEDGARNFFTNIAPDRYRFQVAEVDGEVVGVAALEEGDDFLHHLYIRPDHHRQGIGTALLQWAFAERPEGLQLWCFQENAKARRFYEGHGFVNVEETDGSGNMEQTPDVRYERRPTME